MHFRVTTQPHQSQFSGGSGLKPVDKSGESVQQDRDLAEDEEAGVGFEGGFPLADHAPVAVDPGVGAFDDPSPWLHEEP